MAAARALADLSGVEIPVNGQLAHNLMLGCKNLADHLTSEFRVKTTGRGRDVDEWKLRPGRPDNHWLDCLTGAAVAASMQGVSLAETRGEGPPGKRKRVSMKELMARRKRAS